MVGLRGGDLLENGAGLQQIGVGLVGWRRGGGDAQRIENRGLGIVRICRGEPGHRIAVGDGPRALIRRLDAVVQLRYGVDIGGLAAGLQSSFPCAGGGVTALLKRSGGALPGREGVAPTAQRDAPVGHPTTRVGFDRGFEGGDGTRELE
jgi:hypothetical protein